MVVATTTTTMKTTIVIITITAAKLMSARARDTRTYFEENVIVDTQEVALRFLLWLTGMNYATGCAFGSRSYRILNQVTSRVFLGKVPGVLQVP